MTGNNTITMTQKKIYLATVLDFEQGHVYRYRLGLDEHNADVDVLQQAYAVLETLGHHESTTQYMLQDVTGDYSIRGDAHSSTTHDFTNSMLD